MQLKGVVKKVDSSVELFYASTVLPLCRYRYIPGFMRLSLGVKSQLKKSAGAVRFAIRTDMPKKTFYTFSVWESPELMREFVRVEPHATAIARFWEWRAPDGGATHEWTERGSRDVPWAEIEERLREPTFRYTRRD